MPSKPNARPDWSAIKVEYINGTMSQRELATAHDINAAGLMARANKEKWEDERKRSQAEVSKIAHDKLTEGRIDELTQFNADDLEMAKAIRNRAVTLMETTGALTPTELRSLASAADTAQKIGRLALGAETAKTITENHNFTPITDESWL